MAELLDRPREDESAMATEISLAEHLNLICASKAFESSATRKELLTYLFLHRNEQVNEYSIAVEALHRKPDFDPQIDATVRVQISRLRRRLRDFYLSEGAGTGIRFSIPMGSHQLIVDGTPNVVLPSNALSLARIPESIPALVSQENSGNPFSHAKATFALGCLVFVLGIICGWQAWRLTQQNRVASRTSALELLPFWKDFYANGKPIQIVLPNPTFFHWTTANGADLMVRDTSINSFMNKEESTALTTLEKQLGRPNLVQTYAVSSDIVASLQMVHYLDLRNVDVTTSISSDASSDRFEEKNVILLGTTGTLMPFNAQIGDLYFKLVPHARDTIPNPLPLGSEPKEFKGIDESPTRRIYPGIVTLIPGSSRDSHILILQGVQTAALVSYLTSTAGCQQLKAAQNRAGGGPFFEAVILSEVEGNTILNNRLAAFRRFTPKPAQN